MKSSFLLLLIVSILAACGSDNKEAKVVENLQIQLAVNPDPPMVGESTLMITVADAAGKPIDGAAVAVHGDMDHEGMEPVDSETSASENGVYHVPFEWTMGGGWILDVTITLPDDGGVATAQFERFAAAISQDSIVNKSNGSDEMVHDGMDMGSMNLQIRYEPDVDPALVGDSEVTVIVVATDGTPVEDAIVNLHATMPMMDDMMPVDATMTEDTNGRYVIPLRWTMAGAWEVEITVTQPDGSQSIKIFEQQVNMAE